MVKDAILLTGGAASVSSAQVAEKILEHKKFGQDLLTTEDVGCCVAFLLTRPDDYTMDGIRAVAMVVPTIPNWLLSVDSDANKQQALGSMRS